MTSRSPTPNNAQRGTLPSKALPPAQALAEAWKRESKQSQELWRRIDANVKLRYLAPRKRESRSKM
ncbi:hypothetical protein JOM56_002073 [Amanita muscaria]